MICPSCKLEMPDNFRFCPECGSSVSGFSEHSKAEQDGETSIGGMRTVSIPGPTPHRPADGSIGGLKTRITSPDDSKSRAPSDLIAGRYEIGEIVGEGGFAQVFKCRDVKLDRIVALKKLLVSESQSKQSLERFRREAKAIAALNHKNIVTVFDHDTDGGEAFIIMEFIEGGSLKQYIKFKGGKLPVAESIDIIRGIAQGLAYAHRKNLIHRDIKPGNILIDLEQGTAIPKIVDFGLARVGAGSDVSISGYGLGTPFYMPPEQRRDAKNINHTADIYALGKVLYELVTGEIPDNVDPAMIPPPPALSDVIFKCVKSKPEDRFFSVDDFLKALDAVRVGSATQANNIQSTTVGGYACPSCGRSNPEDARFCEGCGQGFYRNCPECERENKITVQFCSSCGSDIDLFNKISESMERMTDHLTQKRYSRVVKEFGLLPQDPKIRGARGSELWGRAKKLQEAAATNLQEIESLDRECRDARSAGDWSKAVDLIERVKELDPGSGKYDELLAEALTNLDRSDWAAALGKADTGRERNRFKEGIAAVEGYLAAHADGAFRAEAEEQLLDLRHLRDAWVWREAERDAEVLIAASDYAKAAWIYRSFAKNEPSHSATATAVTRSEDLESRAKKQDDDKKWSAVESAAQEQFEAGRHEEAINAVKAFAVQNSESAHRDDAAGLAAALAQKSDRLVAELIRNAREAFEQGDLKTGSDHLARARTFSKRNADIEKLLADVNAKKSKVIELRAYAEKAYKEQYYGEAYEAIAKACSLDAKDPDLLNLKAQYKSAYDREKAKVQAARHRNQLLVGAAIGIVIVAFVSYQANQQFWRFRFNRAIAERNAPAAIEMASHLPANMTSDKLRGLNAYTENLKQFESSFSSYRVLLARYDSKLLGECESGLARLKAEPDIDLALIDLKSLSDRLQAFRNNASRVKAQDDIMSKAILSLTSMNIERLLPNDWNDAWRAVESARGIRELNAAEKAISNLIPLLDKLNARAAELSPRFNAMQADVAKARILGDRLSKHPQRGHDPSGLEKAMKSLDAIEQQVGKTVDFDKTRADIATWSRNAQSLITAFDLVAKEKSAMDARRSDAESKSGARLKPDEWAGLLRDVEAAETVKGIENSANEYKRLAGQFSMMSQELDELLKRESKIRGLDSAVTNMLRRIASHDLARYAEQERAQIAAKYNQNRWRDASPTTYSTVEMALSSCTNQCGYLYRKLEQASRLGASLDQRTRNIDRDLEVVEAKDPDLASDYKEAKSALVNSSDIDAYNLALNKFIEQVDDLTMKADEYRRKGAK